MSEDDGLGDDVDVATAAAVVVEEAHIVIVVGVEVTDLLSATTS